MKWWNKQKRQQRTALTVALCLMAPVIALPSASAQVFGDQRRPAPPRQGMSTGKKVVLLAGAALAYYLFKKHQAKRAQELRQPSSGRQGGMTTARRTPQLYRSKNGGVYYRDQNGRPIWLTAPTRGIQVPAEEVQRYAPDYTRYRGPSPSIPSGARTESFERFDSSLFDNSNYQGSGGRYGTESRGGGGLPPGPRR